MNPLYILDGYGLIYRSYFAFMGKPITNAEGVNIAAVLAFYRALFAFFKSYHPAEFLVALDPKTPSFRQEIYPEYKANREKAPEDLHTQTAIIEEILAALGVVAVRCDGYEADDVIASFAANRASRGLETVVVSADKDLMQLVNPLTLMLRPRSGGTFEPYDEARIIEEKGVKPVQILDYLALIGDASDNIPGVAGIGPKSAVKLLTEHANLDDIYARLDAIKPAGVQEKLRVNRENAYLSLKLAALAYDVDLPECAPEELGIKSLDYLAAAAIFSRIGVPSLAGECKRLAGAEEPALEFTLTGEAPASKHPAPVKPTFQEPEKILKSYQTEKERVSYRVITREDDLSAWVDSMKNVSVFAFDCETDGLDDNAVQAVGMSFSSKENEAVYIPLKCPDPLEFSKERALSLVRPILENPNALVIGQNIKFDYKVFVREGIAFRPGFDTMIAARLISGSNDPVNMDFLAERYLDYKTVSFKETVEKDQTFDQVPLERAGPYAAEDADVTFKLYKKFEPMIKAHNLCSVFYQLEMPLISVLAKMELAGIRINVEKMLEYGVELNRKIADTRRQIFDMVGYEFNISSPKQLADVLFVQRKLPSAKKNTLGFSTDVKVLEDLARIDPLPAKILEYRSFSKLKSTYVDALPARVDAQGRVHTDYLQTGAGTGRLSSREPNLQNIPVRTEDGRRIRSAFESEVGYNLISADYNQIELVMLAHLAKDEAMLDVFRTGRDLHRETAAYIYGIPAETVTGDQRRVAKTINFGIVYGMSAFRLSSELKISRADASGYIDAYFRRYARVRSYMDEIIALAEKEGGVHTLLGRFRLIPGIAGRNRTEKAAAERAAVNTVIQGSAADIVKLAMQNIDKALMHNRFDARILLQVHDEIIMEASEIDTPKAVDLLKSLMVDAGVQTVMPITLSVNVETGKNWGEFH